MTNIYEQPHRPSSREMAGLDSIATRYYKVYDFKKIEHTPLGQAVRVLSGQYRDRDGIIRDRVIPLSRKQEELLWEAVESLSSFRRKRYSDLLTASIARHKKRVAEEPRRLKRIEEALYDRWLTTGSVQKTENTDIWLKAFRGFANRAGLKVYYIGSTEHERHTPRGYYEVVSSYYKVYDESKPNQIAKISVDNDDWLRSEGDGPLSPYPDAIISLSYNPNHEEDFKFEEAQEMFNDIRMYFKENRSLHASDRRVLIKMAHRLPSGDATRRAILSSIREPMGRSFLAEAYKSPGYGYGGYGGGERYRPRMPDQDLKTGVPVEIPFRYQRLFRKSKYEPNGLYVVWVDPDQADGVVKLKRPLVVPWGEAKGPDNWAVRLNQVYGTNSGAELFRALKKDRYDGIITLRDRLRTDQLDLFYDTLGTQALTALGFKSKTYQIVVFDDISVEIREPSAEAVFNRYFALGSYVDVEVPVVSTWSDTLWRDVSLGGLESAIEYREERVTYLEDDRDTNEENLEEYRNIAAALKEVIELIDDIEGTWGHESDISNHRDDIEELNDDIEELNEQIRDIEIGHLEGSLEDKKEEILKKESAIKDLEIEIESLKDLIKEVRDEISETLDSVNLTVNIDGFQSGMSDYFESELEQYEDLVLEAEHEFQSLEGQIESLNSEIEDLETEKEDMENQPGELTHEEEQNLLKLSGVYGLGSDEDYDVSITQDGRSYSVEVTGTHIKAFERTIDFDDMTITNDHLALRDGAPKGLGTRILYSQALAAKAEGFRKISCSAARGPTYVGYYTWARLGYNADIEVAIRQYQRTKLIGNFEDAWEDMVMEGYFPEYITTETDPNDVSMSDLMMTKKGASWWKLDGRSWHATFDLEDQPSGEPSRAMQVLTSYVKLKEKARKESIDKWAAAGVDPKGPPEIKLTEEDLYLLDIVWENLREKELRKRLML